MTDNEFSKIGHALGINTYHVEMSTNKKDKFLPEEFYRNRYCVGSKANSDYELFNDLETKGLAKSWNPYNDDNIFFSITEKGIELFRAEFIIRVTNNFKPISKSQQKYLDWLSLDTDLSFAEYLGIKPVRREYGKGNTIRFSSTKYPNVIGEWKTSVGEAKKSYREKLMNYKNEKATLGR